MKPECIPLKYLDSSPNLDAFIDVGAHYGTYSVVGGQLNPEAITYSFEPDQYNRSVLREVLNINNISAEVRSEVVTDESGEVPFYLDESSGSESHTISSNKQFKKVIKDSISLSEFIENNDMKRVYIKIDAEGGEEKILQDIFPSTIQHIEGIVEIHPDKINTSPNKVINILENNCEVCEFIIDSSPNHPNAESIANETNRPIYYFKAQSDPQ
jgi:FkbM family methyltransferase